MTQQVNATPAKRFFVEMLTRDIELKDSILDLLDNCIDGVMREQKDELDASQPYKGFEAKITFNKEFFQVKDNCGGIPRGVALERAFRMGRPDRDTDKDIPTVGVYGIGMKRAIFKMGQNAVVTSHASDAVYKVEITPEWLEKDDDWLLPISEIEAVEQEPRGTTIYVDQLHSGVSRLFSDATGFVADLIRSISAYYGGIILKGFKVYVNGELVSPLGASFVLDKDTFKEDAQLAPYVYTGEYQGVKIELAVGFYRNLPTDDEEEDSLSGRPSTEHAGWTLICNDRVVLYADKTKVTGWGEAGVPQYHTQFVSIAGVVSFKSNDASLLPVTTTKRGIDGNSELYLSVKEFMREGMKLFTDYTNKWKGPARDRPDFSGRAVSATASDIARMIPQEHWTQDRKSSIKGNKYKPVLPVPPKEDEYRFIRFSRPLNDIRRMGEHFFDNADIAPGEIGGFCFDEVLKRVDE
ncbi:ATP-binding protein [Pseudomonas anuradhapurensis]|uniref:ATP-binding protein n=1 Tax=Pseudomonas anuradhapurensis TaxID=485870 RepID=UPI001646184B|nr:ATP-binding protein [Pseudomonas anuradhapurensis]QXI48236.1 ATP-binding protein [Pseudomonas anuradhapurensis]